MSVSDIFRLFGPLRSDLRIPALADTTLRSFACVS